MQYTIEDYGEKGIFIQYNIVNQQKIDNPKTKKIDVLAFIQFDKRLNYYDNSYELIEKNENKNKFGDV